MSEKNSWEKDFPETPESFSICKIDEAVQMFQIEGGEWLK